MRLLSVFEADPEFTHRGHAFAFEGIVVGQLNASHARFAQDPKIQRWRRVEIVGSLGLCVSLTHKTVEPTANAAPHFDVGRERIDKPPNMYIFLDI